MFVDGCVSCDTITGKITSPGGIIYEDTYWMVFLRSQPMFVPGQSFIVLKRHCEHLGELAPVEAAALGTVMQRTNLALDRVLQPEKVHFGLYAEGVKHLHLHVFPRMPAMPKGNIPITLLSVWYDLLARFHLKRPYTDQAVVEVARQLRLAFQS